jgi:hypothetical protein
MSVLLLIYSSQSPNTSVLNTPAPEASSGSSFRNPADLLGLLRSAQANQPIRQTPPASQSRPVSAADLVAGFGRRPSSIASITSPSLVAPSASRPDLRAEAASTSSASPQDFLLKLLNSQSAKTETFSPTRQTEILSKPIESIEDAATSLPEQSLTAGTSGFPPVQVQTGPLVEPDSQPDSRNTPQAPSKPLFTYTNPFDQLAAATPVNTHSSPAPKPGTPQNHHGKGKQTIPSSVPQEFTPQESPNLSNPPTRETVSEAVGEVGEKVEKQVEEALAQLHLDFPSASSKSKAPATKRPPISDEMEEGLSDNPAVFDTWEAAAAAQGGEHPPIKIFNLPMKPFTSIDIHILEEPPSTIPADSLLHCVRSRKEFDQVDRNLVACTSRYILYAVKDKSFRVINRETAKWQLLFPRADEERIFNIALSLSNPTPSEYSPAVLGTGVKGTVFWKPFNQFEATSNTNNVNGFILPPIESGEDHTSNSQLKTRVKASTRHPEYFAYGRGKFIHIIWPFVASQDSFIDRSTEILDTNKYLAEENLKISTGKAAKDFTFSADDTVIAPLDKAGKLKFWDIQPLTQRKELRNSISHEVKIPIMTLNTCSKSEKAWPTSVMFIDKEKPMNNGYALRYMFVGMKQNHSLQLWDLGLQQQVQEINFPHDDESDAICSLAFNSKLGILVVGHPTRNSIYLMHVSPPKYGLPPMSQAKYMTMLANKDKSLPSLSSTAIVSSIREYTLNNLGKLRSLDLMMDVPSDGETAEKDYVMTLVCYHSKGIFEFTLRRKHLGWSKDLKPLSPTEAVIDEHIKMKALVQPSQDDASSANGDSGSTNGVLSKSDDAAKSSPAGQSASNTSSEKKKKRNRTDGASTPKGIKSPANAETLFSAHSTALGADQINSGPAQSGLASTADANTANREKRMVHSIERALSEQLTLLQTRFEDDRRASEAAAAQKEDALSRQLSQSVSQAIEKNLKPIVTKAVSESLETAKESITNTVDRSVTTAFANAIRNALPREIEKMAPTVANKVSQDHNLTRTLSAAVAKEVSNALVSDMTRAIKEISSALELTVINTSTQAIAGLEQRLATQINTAESRRQSDNLKFDALNTRISSLMTLVKDVFEQNAQLNANVIAQLQNTKSSRPSSSAPLAQYPGNQTAAQQSAAPAYYNNSNTVASSSTAPPVDTDAAKPKAENIAQNEMTAIATLLREQQYEAALYKVRYTYLVSDTS